jgi:hypothetical protein
MALFGNDYDNDFGYRTGRWGAYDRGYLGNAGERAGWRDEPGYDRGYTAFGGNPGNEYDRGYKNRWQTDYGDPFGDRTSRTPMRAIRGPYRTQHPCYDRGYLGYDRGYSPMDRNLRSGYGEDYRAANPMSYEPYRRGSRNRYDERFSRLYGRDRDAGWF